MKKSFPDMIISIVLLAFLTSLAVQVPQIPAVSKGYPLVLLIVSYLMTLSADQQCSKIEIRR